MLHLRKILTLFCILQIFAGYVYGDVNDLYDPKKQKRSYRTDMRHLRKTNKSWGQRRLLPTEFIGVYASGGYSTILPLFPNSVNPGGAGGNFGFCFELVNTDENFWMNVGLGAQIYSSSTKIKPFKFDAKIEDTETVGATEHYEVMQWRDFQTFYGTELSVMFGFKKKCFYVGVGPKLTFISYAKGKGEMSYLTSATYPRYFDDFYDMPNHYYTLFSATTDKSKGALYPSLKGGSLSNRFSGAAAFEIGYNVLDREYESISQKEKRRKDVNQLVIKTALYAECGFLNINGFRNNGHAMAFNMEDAAHIGVNPYFTTDEMKGKFMIPFYAGVKITLLWRVRGKCDYCPLGRSMLYKRR